MCTPYSPARSAPAIDPVTDSAARRGPPRRRGNHTHNGRSQHGRSRGVASVLAMLYMVIFSVMALGFYAATTTATQVSSNERTSNAALLSAESGTQFLRYHLSLLDIKAGLTPDKIFEQVYQQLAEHLEPTANLGGNVIGYDGTTISIPQTGYIKIDPSGAQKFRITMTRAGDILVARVVGRGGTVSLGRGLEFKFQKANNATAIFNYGVASNGTVSTSGASTITGLTDPTKGSILSTDITSLTPVSIMGKLVSGDISVVSDTANVQFGSNTSIGGTTNTQLIRAEHIHRSTAPPRFPDVDATVYKQYATNTYVSGMKNLDNVRIPAGTGTAINPLKLDTVTVRGVLYIEGSNVIDFAGNCNLQAVIVTANDAPLPVVSGGQIVNNLISFSGSVSAQSVATLPDSFGDVKKLTGALILAPNYRVRMWGNFGAVGGTVVAGQFQMGGSAEGTIKGSIIQTTKLATTIDGSADVVIASVGTTEYPAGVTFGIHYTGIPGSYLEIPVP